TTILGAAKLSGRTATGWSMGLLEALTERERATVFDAATGARYSDPVEPLTNYFVGRMKHTSADGNTTVGALGTAANRRLDAPVFDQLPTAAYGSGVDFFHRWGRNTYSLAASVGGSFLAGDTLAIQRDVGAFGYMQLRNFWSVNWTAKYEMPVLDDRLTRGGPLAATPPAWYGSGQLTTDTRKHTSWYAFASYSGDAAGGWLVNVLPQLTLRPNAALFLSVGPGYVTGRFSAQYVTRHGDSTAMATLGSRYVFA